LLIDPQDVNGASHQIARLHDDRSLGHRLGLAAHSLVRDTYDIESYAIRMKHAYELLLADRSVRLINDSAMAQTEAAGPTPIAESCAVR
jgi:hypothetical protein